MGSVVQPGHRKEEDRGGEADHKLIGWGGATESVVVGHDGRIHWTPPD